MTMNPVESTPRRTRQTGRRSALLVALRAADRPMRVDEVAAAAGIAESTAQFHLSLLVSSGLAEREAARTGSAGRPSWCYSAAATAVAASTSTDPDSYRELARVLAAQLDGDAGAADAAREAGRRWADALPADGLRPADSPAAAIGALSDAFDRLGFAPDRPSAAPGRASGQSEIVLRACPFESVAREHRAVVCGVHLGLAERTAAAIGGGIAIDGIEPFRSEQPLSCAVRVRVPA
jgi:predicted ArsR family transcriptional regulator